MIYFVDLDETLVYNKNNNDVSCARDYRLSLPIEENIKKVNRLYEEGHTIIIYSARGCLTGIDWSELTKKQLEEFGVKYHQLRLDKPYYDFFIDDKAINTKDWK